MIDLKWVREHTDCTSTFLVCTKIDMTVGQFINEWITNNTSEHGTFHICSSEKEYDHPEIEVRYEYDQGKITMDQIPIGCLFNFDKMITHASASGGYGETNFYIEFMENENIKMEWLAYKFEEIEIDDKQLTGGCYDYSVCRGSNIEEVISNYCKQHEIPYIASEITFSERGGFQYKTALDEEIYFIELPDNFQFNPKKIAGFIYED